MVLFGPPTPRAPLFSVSVSSSQQLSVFCGIQISLFGKLGRSLTCFCQEIGTIRFRLPPFPIAIACVPMQCVYVYVLAVGVSVSLYVTVSIYYVCVLVR